MVKPLSDFTSSELFTIIGESSRLRILDLLFGGERAVDEIRSALKIEKTLLSKHLSALRSADLVLTRRLGRHVLYALNPKIKSGPRSLKLHCCEIKLKSID